MCATHNAEKEGESARLLVAADAPVVVGVRVVGVEADDCVVVRNS